uniref:Uncharacterized protein n=1 Tax=Oryza brachyantha TaxID=4533 RepID=J3LAR0_ORYBR
MLFIFVIKTTAHRKATSTGQAYWSRIAVFPLPHGFGSSGSMVFLILWFRER